MLYSVVLYADINSSNLLCSFTPKNYHNTALKNAKEPNVSTLNSFNTSIKGPSIKYIRKIFRKTNISNRLIRTRTCAYQGVRNVSFSENFAYVLNGWHQTKYQMYFNVNGWGPVYPDQNIIVNNFLWPKFGNIYHQCDSDKEQEQPQPQKTQMQKIRTSSLHNFPLFGVSSRVLQF